MNQHTNISGKFFWRVLLVFVVIEFLMQFSPVSTTAFAQSTTVLGTVASQMASGTWTSLSSDDINTVLGRGGITGNQLPFSFSGAWDPVRLVLHFTGADHGDGITHYMTYDATTNRWTFLGSMPSAPSHGYDHNAVDPLTGTLYVRQYALGGQWTIWKLPPGGSWTVATTYDQGYQQVAIGTAWWSGPLAGGGSQGTYAVYNCGEPNGQLALWNPTTGSWFADLRNFGGSSTYHCFIEYSPVKNVAVFGGGNDNPRKIWRLNADRTVTPLADAPVDLGIQRANVVVDPVTGNFLVMGYGQLWELNPAGSGTWTLQTGSRVPPSAVGNPGSPNYDSVISASIPNYGVVMYVTCRASNCNTYLYKHAAGGGTLPPSDTTPPSTPTNLQATAVSSSQINLSWSASTDNVGVAGYRVYRNGTQIATTSSTSYQDTGLSPSTTYSYTVAAYDAAGNLSAQSSPVSATTLSSSTPPSSGGSDFQTRCSQPGVVKCVGFDSTAEISGAWGIDPQGSLAGTGGSPAIDTVTKASGNGSLRFVVPAGQSGGAAGSFFANFSDDLSVQFGENSEFYVQWRMRIDDNFYAATQGLVGMKHSIIGTGSRPGSPAASCTDLEIVTQNSWRRGFTQMYHSCAGDPINYEPIFDDPFGSYDFKLQNARPAPYCLYSQGQTTPVSYFPPTGNCFGYFPNEWMTFQIHVKLGPRQQVGGYWYFTNSTVELWLGREGRPSELVISAPGRNLEATNPLDKYGQIWLLPYSGNDVYPSGGRVWYDELIISRARIADPGGAVPPASADTTAPSTPTGLTATAVSTSQVNLSWTASTDNVGVAGYRIYRNGTQIATTSSTSYQDTGLSPSTTYSYTVAAYDAAGNLSAQSSPQSATTLAPADTTPPSTPTNLQATAVSSSQINLSWTASTDNVGVTGYLLERCQGSSCTNFVQIGTPSTTSYSDSGLASATTYRYRVRAKDAAGNLSGYSNIAAATTQAPASLNASISANPSSGTAPLNNVSLTATAGGTATGTINYTFYCNRTDTGTNITTPYDAKLDNTTLTSYTATNVCNYLNPGTYTAKVIIERGTLAAQAQQTISVSAPAPSTKFNLNDRVQVTSTANVRATPSTSGTLLGTQNTGALGTVIGGPTYADGFFWWNVNYDSGADGWSIENNLAKFVDTTPPSTPTNLTATAVSSSQINLSWTASTDNVGVTGYRVERCQGSSCTNFTQIATPTTNSYSDTGLAASTQYTYRVRATDAAGNLSGYSGTASATTLFAAPGGGTTPSTDTTPPTVFIVFPTSGQTVSGTITVSANASDNVGVSGVQFKLDSQNLGEEDTVSPYSILWDTRTTTNGSHTLTAVARDSSGNQATSSPVTVTVSNVSSAPPPQPSSDTTPPSTPTNLQATAVSSSQINLSWTASTDNVGVTGYRIYRNGTQIATTSSTSYQDTGLSPSTTYSYTVAAYDASGNLSAQSSPQSATTYKFTIGDRVMVTTKKLNIRATPSGKIIGSHKLNDQGTVIEGPVAARDRFWWNIDYDTAPDGWSAENWLEKVSSLSGASSLEATPVSQPSYQPSTPSSGSSLLPSAPQELTQQQSTVIQTTPQGGLTEGEIATIQARIQELMQELLTLLMQLQELLRKQLQR